MKKKPIIVKYTLSQVEALRERGEDPSLRNTPRADSLARSSGSPRVL